MSKNNVENVVASVRQKLLNQSREKGEDFQLLLTRYGLERFLYRLSRSSHQDRFVLGRFLIPLRDAVGCSSSDGDRNVCLASGGMLTYNGE